MKQQLDMIRQTPWDALIVLDACRADYFAEVAGPCEVVAAPGVCTPTWVRAVGPVLADLGVRYFTANPVVDRECSKLGLALEVVSVWQSQWGRFTELGIPSVHPLCVNGIVAGYGQLGLLDGRRIVVHYLQPHSPYIGRVPLALARWGGTGGQLAQAVGKLGTPDRAVRRGQVGWDVVRDAYRANLELVWHAARMLAAQLHGRVIVTSDHGELLGEGNRFGHESHWRDRALREVPWLVMPEPERDQENVLQKLTALGYAA